MYASKLRVGSLAVLLLALVVAPAMAGHRYTIQSTNHKNGHTDTSLIKVDGLNLWIGMAKLGRKEQDGAIIFKGDRREGLEPRVIILDGEGGHMIITHAKMREIASNMPKMTERSPVMNEQMLEMARRQIESIADPEARARALEEFEKRFGGEDSEESNVEHVERGVRQKNGYPTVRIESYRDGTKFAETYATDWVNVKGGREAKRAFEAFGAFYRELMEILSDASGMALDMFGSDSNPFQKMLDLGKFVIASDEFANGEKVRSSDLTAAERVDHEPGTFKPGPESVERTFGM